MTQPIQIEQTAKVYKTKMLVGTLAFLGGAAGLVIAMLMHAGVGPKIVLGLVAVIGLGASLLGKFQAWWHHG